MPGAIFTNALPGLVAASADESKSNPIPLNLAAQVSGSLEWGAGVTAGKVVFELAVTQNYAGIWQVIFSSDFVADGVVANIGAPPCVQAFTYPGSFEGFGRWRIDTAIVGGTVNTYTQKLAGY